MKPVEKFWFLTQNDEDVLLFIVIRQAQSMKHHLTETHEHNSEHNPQYCVILTKYFCYMLHSRPVRKLITIQVNSVPQKVAIFVNKSEGGI